MAVNAISMSRGQKCNSFTDVSGVASLETRLILVYKRLLVAAHWDVVVKEGPGLHLGADYFSYAKSVQILGRPAKN